MGSAQRRRRKQSRYHLATAALLVEMARADILVLSFVRSSSEAELRDIVEKLDTLGEKMSVWIGLTADHALVGRLQNVRMFHTFEDMDAALTQARVRVKVSAGRVRGVLCHSR